MLGRQKWGWSVGRILKARPEVHSVGKDIELPNQYSSRLTWEGAAVRWETSWKARKQPKCEARREGLDLVGCLQRGRGEEHRAMQNAPETGKRCPPPPPPEMAVSGAEIRKMG